MGDCETHTPVWAESLLKYHSDRIGLLTSNRHPVQGQCLVGSLTGAVASQNVTEAPKGSLNLDGNQVLSASAQGSLTARLTRQAGTKVGLVIRHPEWKGVAQRIKRYPGDNRLIFPKSPYRRDGLAPRCRLVASWGWSRSQGLGCSPIKAARELGLERRETVRSLSAARVRNLRKPVPSTRDRDGRTSGPPVVPPGAPLDSHVRTG